MEQKFLAAFQEALELEREVKMEDVFRDYAEWDSMSHLSLIAMLDSEFNIQIENLAFGKLKTVEDIFKYVSERATK